MKNILVVGANSGIAQEYCRLKVEQKNCKIFIVGRDSQKLEILQKDLTARGGNVDSFACDLSKYDTHKIFLDKAVQFLGSLDVILIAHAVMPDASINDMPQNEHIFRVNYFSVVSIFSVLIENKMIHSGNSIAVISSVSGDRGLAHNGIYGASKAALNIFLGTMRKNLSREKIHILTIKPGYVDTPMTDHLKKGILFAHPKKVAADISSAIEKKRELIYTPGYWRLILFCVKLIPEKIFKLLKI